jgi:hypothetical protein
MRSSVVSSILAAQLFMALSACAQQLTGPYLSNGGRQPARTPDPLDFSLPSTFHEPYPLTVKWLQIPTHPCRYQLDPTLYYRMEPILGVDGSADFSIDVCPTAWDTERDRCINITRRQTLVGGPNTHLLGLGEKLPIGLGQRVLVWRYVDAPVADAPPVHSKPFTLEGSRCTAR